MKNIKEKYKINKAAKVGNKCVCPSCGTHFMKTHYAQAFCKSRGGTKCKDKYWNTVDPKKKNNTTRISPASAAWLADKVACKKKRYTSEGYEIINGVAYDEWGEPIYNYNVIFDEIHPFSGEAFGDN